MTRARSQQICLEATPYYHCVSRCVRRTFLCGYDIQSRKSYEHRRDWIETRIKELAFIYCIDICAYAVMSNHYHIVVHINKTQAESLTDMEVIERWIQIHTKPDLIQRFLSGQINSKTKLKAVKKIILEWRMRLFSLSWFMRDLNFEIALKANREDDCKGHFWESRYKSQALLDEKALLAAMAYTDLNPVRAGTAKAPETSEYTSIKARLNALKKHQSTALGLHPFIGNSKDRNLSGLPFRLMDYIALIDWTSRSFRQGKARINNQFPPLLERLNITQQDWLLVCTKLEKRRALLVGDKTSFNVAIPVMQRQRKYGYQLG